MLDESQGVWPPVLTFSLCLLGRESTGLGQDSTELQILPGCDSNLPTAGQTKPKRQLGFHQRELPRTGDLGVFLGNSRTLIQLRHQFSSGENAL